MIQRKYLIPVGVVALLVLVWTLGWFWFAREIQLGLEDFAARHAGNEPGNPVTLSWDGVRVDGYPNRLNTHISRPRGTWSGPDGNVDWAGADTVLRFFMDGGRTVSFRAPGAHDVTLQRDGRTRILATDSAQLSGRLDFDGRGQATGLRGRASGLDVGLDGQPVTTLDEAAFDWSRLQEQPDSESIHPVSTGQSLIFSLSGVSLVAAGLDANVTENLGRRLDRLAGHLSVRGALDPTDISPAGLARWRDAGGTVELSDFTLVWGPLRIAGEGTLAVDQALQPVGAFTAQIAGLDRLINLLEQNGNLPPQQAAIARIALAVLTRAPANGGPLEARVPVSIQNRQLSVGPIPLLRLPVIDWN